MNRPRRPHRSWRSVWNRWLAWEWQPFRWLHLSIDLTMMNRPQLLIDDCHPRRWWSLSWGNGNSDPVWSIDVERTGIWVLDPGEKGKQ